MSIFLSVLYGWLGLNLAIAAAMYFKPLRARGPLKSFGRYGSSALRAAATAPLTRTRELGGSNC
jgi:hypothetical protein